MLDTTIAPRLKPIREDVLEFIRDQLKIFQTREDYRELLRLALMFLGAGVEECGHVRAPGAYHRARWMAKVI